PYREPGSRKPEEAVAILIEAGANPNAKSTDGTTLLHQAARLGNLDMIRALAAAKVDFTQKNNDGYTALDVAEGKQPATGAGGRAGGPPPGGADAARTSRTWPSSCASSWVCPRQRHPRRPRKTPLPRRKPPSEEGALCRVRVDAGDPGISHRAAAARTESGRAETRHRGGGVAGDGGVSGNGDALLRRLSQHAQSAARRCSARARQSEPGRSRRRSRDLGTRGEEARRRRHAAAGRPHAGPRRARTVSLGARG